MDNQQRIAVLGASGLVGKAVTDYLLTKGKFAVNAVARNPGALGINHIFARLIQADVSKVEQVEEAVEGCSAVVVTVSKGTSSENLLTQYAPAIVQALKNKGISRVIVVAGAGSIPIGEGKYIKDTPHFPVEFMGYAEDHVEMLKIFNAAGFQQTTVCPPLVKNLPFTGNYVLGVDTLAEPNLWYVGQREVADFILKEIQNPQYVGKSVNISNIEQ